MPKSGSNSASLAAMAGPNTTAHVSTSIETALTNTKHMLIKRQTGYGRVSRTR